MAIYMQFDGGRIKGNATHGAHKEWMDLHSFQFGVGRGISTPTGATGNRDASHPSISEVVVSRTTDAASPKLFEEACVGQKGVPVVIHFVTTGNPGETYLEITLTNTLISGLSTTTGGDRPTESISLNFTKIEYKYIPNKEDNTAGSPVSITYDTATAKKG